MAQTSYTDIKIYHSNLVSELTQNGIPFGVDKFPLFIRMSVSDADLGRLKTDSGCSDMIASFGLDGDKNLILSFLALNSSMEVDKSHIDNSLDGEESWDPASVTYFGNAPTGSAGDTLP